MAPSFGGPCQGIRNSIPALEALGVENEVVCLDHPEDADARRDPFKVHALGRGKPPWSFHQKLLPWLNANLEHYDAAILHGLWLYPGFALRIAARRTGTPYFVFPHGMLDPWFQRDSSRRLKAIRNEIYWRLAESAVIAQAKGLLFTSEEEMRRAATTFSGYRPKAQNVVGYGVPDPPPEEEEMHRVFRSHCSPLPEKHPYLLFLSRIHPKKGIDLLLKAYTALVREQQNGAGSGQLPSLVIAGPGLDSSFGREIQDLAQTLLPQTSSIQAEISPGIHFPGMLEGDAKWGAFFGCEAFILPSHQENFGIAVAEALACSKPVLISNQVNIWREIERAGAGLVADDNQAGVHQLLTEWQRLRSRSVSMEMRLAARSCYENHFRNDTAVESLRNCLTAHLGKQ